MNGATEVSVPISGIVSGMLVLMSHESRARPPAMPTAVPRAPMITASTTPPRMTRATVTP